MSKGKVDTATGAVTVGDPSFAGGLVAINNGSISQAYATGAVTGGAGSYVGGLVAQNLWTLMSAPMQLECDAPLASAVTSTTNGSLCGVMPPKICCNAE